MLWKRASALVVAFLLSCAAPAAADVLPDARLTPGAVGTSGAPAAGAADVCARGYARRARHRYDAQWRRYRVAMFREYGLPHAVWSRYTVDHLIPLELGGRAFGVSGNAWDLRNVWPEPKNEAVQKDAVENALREAVCDAGGYRGVHVSLSEAQRTIARDWRHTPVGLPAP